jgi:hypothetical protein
MGLFNNDYKKSFNNLKSCEKASLELKKNYESC